MSDYIKDFIGEILSVQVGRFAFALYRSRETFLKVDPRYIDIGFLWFTMLYKRRC